MQKYQNNVQTLDGRAIVGASVTVTEYPGGAPATVYNANGSGVITQPILTNGDGEFAFYAANGRYQLQITGGGISVAQSITDVILFDPADAGIVPTGAFITSSQTLNVPTDYASISAALTYLGGLTIVKDAIVTIQVANGTYVQSSVNYCAHPNGVRIRIIGNTTTPASCKIQCASSDAFYVPAGYEIGEINGFYLEKTGSKANIGVLTDSGSISKLGPMIVTDNFYYGVASRYGGNIVANGTSASDRVLVLNAGDAGFWAYEGGDLFARYGESQGANDSANGLGSGFVAEFGGNIDATSSKSTGSFLAGYGAFTVGSIRAWGCTSQTNANGLQLKSNGRIEVFNGATINNNTSYGYISDGTSSPNGWSTATTTPNGIGDHLLTATDPAAFTTLATTSTATLNALATGSATISGGTLNNVSIGATTRAAASITTLNANGLVTLDGAGPRIDWNTGGPYIRLPTTNVLELGTNGSTNVMRVSAGGKALFGTTADNGNDMVQSNGHIATITAGQGLKIKEGSNAKQGTAVLVAGTVVVSNTSVTANSRIFLTSNADGGTPGFVRVSARSAGASFTITSSSGTDTSTIAYEIFEPS